MEQLIHAEVTAFLLQIKVQKPLRYPEEAHDRLLAFQSAGYAEGAKDASVATVLRSSHVPLHSCSRLNGEQVTHRCCPPQAAAIFFGHADNLGFEAHGPFLKRLWTTGLAKPSDDSALIQPGS